MDYIIFQSNNYHLDEKIKQCIILQVAASSAVAVQGSENVPASPAKVIDMRCLALARFFNRLARHLKMRKDPNCGTCIEEKDILKALKPRQRKSRDKWASTIERLALLKDNLAAIEIDSWFQTKSMQREQHKLCEG